MFPTQNWPPLWNPNMVSKHLSTSGPLLLHMAQASQAWFQASAQKVSRELVNPYTSQVVLRSHLEKGTGCQTLVHCPSHIAQPRHQETIPDEYEGVSQLPQGPESPH